MGKNCVSPNCSYIERASSSRFSRPPVPTVGSCIKFPVTCDTVGNITYAPNEYVSPTYWPSNNQCATKTLSDRFQNSWVAYGHL